MPKRIRSSYIVAILATINLPVFLWLLYQAAFFNWVIMTPNGERLQTFARLYTIGALVSGVLETGFLVHGLRLLCRRAPERRGFPISFDGEDKGPGR